ncbi:hypothetical protein GFL86_21945 [Rhizobium laguerreae]|nr:hypothetical protein [Rhizobium laguerreae]
MRAAIQSATASFARLKRRAALSLKQNSPRLSCELSPKVDVQFSGAVHIAVAGLRLEDDDLRSLRRIAAPVSGRPAAGGCLWPSGRGPLRSTG